MRPPRTGRTPAAARSASLPRSLAAVAVAEPLLRSETAARVWAYMRAHGLQDPTDRRVLLPDERLRTVSGRERVDMLAMVGLLSPLLRAL